MPGNVTSYDPKAWMPFNYLYSVADTAIPYSQLERELGEVYDKAVEALKSEIAQAQKNQEAGREQEGTAQRVLESAVSATLTVEERKQALKTLKNVKKLIAAASDVEMKAQAKLQEVVVKRAALDVSMIGDENDDDRPRCYVNNN